MKEIYTLLMLLLGLNLFLGFLRVFRGPSVVDSMLASLLLGTGGTAILLLTYKVTQHAYFINIALAFALVAGVVGVAFAIILLRDVD
ncbi:MAG: hypothetical protein RMK75_00150 [Aquificaceae bacterium]|nr:hypothetical protein [Aquificaceae bacterium]MDW8422723.1 hypothetical protein [Aquificaceae bacterium]